MMDSARLSDHAAARIDEMRAEGIDLTPAEIVRINSLGWAVESPETRLDLARGTPVEVGGVTLWPLTMRAYDWHRRVCGSMPTVWHSRVALAYAMAHGYADGPRLTRYGVAAVAAISAWGATLRCTTAALVEAMAQVIQQDETEAPVPDADEDGTRRGIGDLSADITAITGMAPEAVEANMSMHHAIRIAELTLQRQAEAGGEKARMRSRSYAMANKAMALYLMEIRQARKAAENGKA